MKCLIKSIELRERENNLPYFVFKATHTEGGVTDAKDLFANGMLNPNALFSRVQNFTKTIFPASQMLVDAYKELYNITEANEPKEDFSDVEIEDAKYIGLKLIRVPSPKPYYIIDSGTGEFISNDIEVEIEKTADKPIKIGDKMIAKGQTYKVTETKSVPKVYTEIQLVVLCDNEEKCIEGDEKELANYQWSRRIGDTWIIADDVNS